MLWHYNTCKCRNSNFLKRNLQLDILKSSCHCNIRQNSTVYLFRIELIVFIKTEKDRPYQGKVNVKDCSCLLSHAFDHAC